MESKDKILPQEALDSLHQRQAQFSEQGVDEALANHVGMLKMLSTAWDVVRLKQTYPDWDLLGLARCYSHLGTRFWFDFLRSSANQLQSAESSSWNQLALSAVIDDLWVLQFTLTRKILKDAPVNQPEAFNHWLEAHGKDLHRVDNILHDIVHHPLLDLAMLSVSVRELRAFIGE